MTLLATVTRRPRTTGEIPHHPAHPPYADNGRIPWEYLTERQREQVQAWLVDHGVDPADAPVGGLFDYDPATNEWRIEIGRRRPDGAALFHRGGPRDGALVTVVRRVWANPPPRRRGPIVNTPTRVQVNGVDLTPYLTGAGKLLHGHEHRRAR